MPDKNDNRSGFIDNSIEGADHLAMSEWKSMLPGDATKYFEKGLPEGSTVEGRMYAQVGLVLKVTEGGETTTYMLKHDGDPRFPDGKAVKWNE